MAASLPHTVIAQDLAWLSRSTYAEYNSSPGCYRAFCKNCGSNIGWTDNKINTDVELATGLFDEEFLVGQRGNEDPEAYGLALANPAGDLFHIRNEIQEVPTGLFASGVKFWKEVKMVQ